MSNWEKVEPYKGLIHRGCACCSDVRTVAHDDMVIAVGFGSANVTKDGEIVWEEETSIYSKQTELWQASDAEKAALTDPDHDWRITMFGPLHGEVYQRHGPGQWVLIESNQGFA